MKELKDLNSYGNSMRMFIAQSGNTAENGLYMARQMGNAIKEMPITDKEKQALVGATYGQYVIATSLKPLLDAKPFLAEVRKAMATK